VRRRKLAFVLLVAACVSVAGGFVAWGALRQPEAAAGPAAFVRSVTRAGSYVVFENLTLDGEASRYHDLAVAPLGRPGPRALLGMRCLRVYFAGGRGLCLAAGGGFGATTTARILGPDFSVRHELVLNGLASRARISADGRYGSVTTFVGGDSYASQGSFSTRTTLIDMRQGIALSGLERFRVTRNGRRLHAPDFNFWGVTFARDSNRFYATLATAGTTYLIAGDLRARRARVLRENVECPSLSPDDTRIAYKKRITFSGSTWRLHVLDLRTMRDTALAETESVDDQVEWLGGNRILYGLASDVWQVPADGTGKPRLYLRDANSPAIVSRRRAAAG
jgi:hypothetical protein